MTKKITIAVPFENVEIATSLMAQTYFLECDRVASGGMMSNPVVLITFQGEDSNYNPQHYIEKKNSEFISTYYSLNVIDGYTTKDFDKFLELHNGRNSKLEVKLIPQSK